MNTCINIMLTIYAKNIKASLGFIGANNLDEEVDCTKRYRVYSKIIATYFVESFFVEQYEYFDS